MDEDRSRWEAVLELTGTVLGVLLALEGAARDEARYRVRPLFMGKL